VLSISTRNTFPIPEIVFDPSLIFSPHCLLLGLIFDDQAFAAPNLTSSTALSKVYIEPGYNQLPLLLDPEWADVPVFRKAIAAADGWAVSATMRLTYSVLYSSMRTLGQITGFKQITRPYGLRYGAGKAFNENG
jgi:uncharacterized protein DUF3435